MRAATKQKPTQPTAPEFRPHAIPGVENAAMAQRAQGESQAFTKNSSTQQQANSHLANSEKQHQKSMDKAKESIKGLAKAPVKNQLLALGLVIAALVKAGSMRANDKNFKQQLQETKTKLHKIFGEAGKTTGEKNQLQTQLKGLDPNSAAYTDIQGKIDTCNQKLESLEQQAQDVVSDFDAKTAPKPKPGKGKQKDKDKDSEDDNDQQQTNDEDDEEDDENDEQVEDETDEEDKQRLQGTDSADDAEQEAEEEVDADADASTTPTPSPDPEATTEEEAEEQEHENNDHDIEQEAENEDAFEEDQEEEAEAEETADADASADSATPGEEAPSSEASNMLSEEGAEAVESTMDAQDSRGDDLQAEGANAEAGADAGPGADAGGLSGGGGMSPSPMG